MSHWDRMLRGFQIVLAGLGGLLVVILLGIALAGLLFP